MLLYGQRLHSSDIPLAFGHGWLQRYLLRSFFYIINYYSNTERMHLLLSVCEERGFKTMNAEIIREIEQEQLKSDIPAFQVGDTIRVYAKIKEGTRERIQMFEGIVVRRTGGGIRENVTVRRLSSGVGVEKTWPLNSPSIDHIQVMRHGKVRRAKLNYLRDRVGKAAKVKEKI